VAVTAPGYSIPGRGARWIGADVLRLPLRAENDFLPDLDAVDEETWRRLALVWINYPNNPTGAVAPAAFYDRLARIQAILGADLDDPDVRVSLHVALVADEMTGELSGPGAK